MFLAADTTGGSFTGFDIFMILFTILIVAGFVRLATQEKKNLFAIGFTGLVLLVFLYADYLMVRNWMGIL